MAGNCISDDEVVCRASKDEIIRRYFNTMCDSRRGRVTPSAVEKLELIMQTAGVTVDERPVVGAALEKSKSVADANHPEAVAIELPDGRIVTGKTSALLGPAAAAVLNAIKAMCNIPKQVHLIAPSTIEPIQRLKVEMLGNRNPRLHTDEALIALSISAATSEDAANAFAKLKELRDCEAHSTIIPSQVDEDVYRKLGIHLTCEPRYNTKKLFHK